MSENIYLWSTTASSNDVADPAVPWQENMLPGQVNNSARSTMAGIARLLADINGTLATTGSSNAYLVTSSSGVTAFTNGQLLTIRASFSNTGAATLNLNSLGAKKIRIVSLWGEADLDAYQIISGGLYQLSYNSSANSAAGAWMLLNPATNTDTGTIRLWPSDTAPTNGWLFCNGQSVSRTTYAGLFAVVGTTYGAGDGSTTFAVPDFRGRAAFGSDDMGTTAAGRITNANSGIVGTTLGASGGVESVTLDSTQIPSHTHTGTTASGGSHTHTGTTSAGSAHTHTGTTDSGGVDHNHSIGFVVGTGIQTSIGANGGASNVPNGAFTDTATGGASAFSHTHTFTTAAESSHTHTFTTAAGGAHTHTFTSDATGGGLLHTNMPPALIVNFIIKV